MTGFWLIPVELLAEQSPAAEERDSLESLDHASQLQARVLQQHSWGTGLPAARRVLTWVGEIQEFMSQ